MQVLPAGDNAVLVELGDVSAEELHRAAAHVSAISGVQACVVGHSSLYVIGMAILDFGLPILDWRPNPKSKIQNPKSIRVSFADAPDLEEFLQRTQQSREQFLERLRAVRLTVRYLGFRGGFAYLDGWPEEWAMPRRATSRPRVPRGTFAIAGNVAGFYPIETPGGWNLLGRTDEDLEYALTPGDVLTIEPQLALAKSEVVASARRPRAAVATQRQFEVIAAPLMTRVHPPDYSLLSRGIPPGGPFDDIAAALAMRAVGQCEALFECAMVGPRLRFREDAITAWCGPDLHLRIDRVKAGEELAIGRITGGLRGYLAIGQGEGVVAKLERGDRHVIGAMSGPHSLGLSEVECEVTPQLDRVGVRLRPLQRIEAEIPADLRSIGMQCGTVQLHPDGSMIAMGPDHPVTGGYLQPMTVLTSDRWKLGQLMPGERVSFRIDTPTAPRP